MAHEAGCGLVLLAHHRRDQAETLLLQALRGGGPAGLAAMPRSAVRDGITWARPWLDQPREAIEAYVRRYRLRFADDASNDDPRFARNRLRLGVWPALTQAFPDAESQLQAAARRAQEASACLLEIAHSDLAVSCDGNALVIERWQALSPPRRTLLMREWLRGVCPQAAPESLVQRLAAELAGRHVGRWPAPGGEIVLYRGRLLHEATPPLPVATPPEGQSMDLSRPGRHALPQWSGTLVVRRVADGGVVPERLSAARLQPRVGGERFQLGAGSMPRSLKKQYQASGLPAGQRQGPLIYDGPTLLFAPGLGIDARCLAPVGADQLGLHWEPQSSGLCQPGV
jgi:tRNA(Ile)-lysidine synthase